MQDIQKDVPLPRKASLRSVQKDIPLPRGRRYYPWRHMEPGDSIFFPDEPDRSQSNPSRAARQYARRTGKVFTARPEGDGVRIWRVT